MPRTANHRVMSIGEHARVPAGAGASRMRAERPEWFTLVKKSFLKSGLLNERPIRELLVFYQFGRLGGSDLKMVGWRIETPKPRRAQKKSPANKWRGFLMCLKHFDRLLVVEVKHPPAVIPFQAYLTPSKWNLGVWVEWADVWPC